jgi:hypothetical protein
MIRLKEKPIHPMTNLSYFPKSSDEYDMIERKTDSSDNKIFTYFSGSITASCQSKSSSSA